MTVGQVNAPKAWAGLQKVRDALVDAPDRVCLERARLVTEAWQAHEREPLPVRRAMALRHILEHMTLDVTTNPLIAGNTSSSPRAWMLCPEYGIGIDAQVAIENDGLDGLLDDVLPAEIADYWRERASGGAHGIGHLAVDLQRVVERGLRSTISDLQAPGPAGEAAEQRDYRRAMRIACEAVIAWAGRYAEAADRAAAAADDPMQQAAHRRVARACRHVPGEPARDLFEGLQAIALVQLAIHIEGHGMSVSIGLLDRVLGRFNAQAQTNPQRAAADIAALALCLMANGVQGRGSTTQALTIGGIDAAGADRCNAITMACLEAWDRIRPNDPHLFLRWHRAIDPAVKDKAIAMLSRGVSMPLLMHDEPTVAGLARAGIGPDDAFDYCVIGCNELGIPGRLAMSAAPIVSTDYLPRLRTWLIEHGNDPAIDSIHELFERFAEWAAQRTVDRALHAADRHRHRAETRPTPFTSALMRRSFAEGRDMHDCQTYRAYGIYERGLTNAANALAAIEQVVFDQQALSLGELVAALEADLPDEALRQRLRDAPKFGNDDDRADRWALRLLEIRRAATDRLEREHDHPPYLACHVVRSLHRLNGLGLGATPDGRHAGEPLADSLGAEIGTATEGPTAMLNSVLKIDAAAYYGGGTNLNLTLSPQAAEPGVLRALVDAFFDAGGQELQVNALDVATLRDALARPDRYRDLIVRIAGFNALWCKLSQAEREEIVARAVAAF